MSKLMKQLEVDESLHKIQEMEKLLRKELNDEQRKTLVTVQKAYQENLNYIRVTLFGGGMMHAFERFFLEETEQFSYRTMIEEGIHTASGMQKHPGYYANSMRINEQCEIVEEQLAFDAREHLILYCCAWDQLIFATSIAAYFQGYMEGSQIVLTFSIGHTERQKDLLLTLKQELEDAGLCGAY